MGLSPIISACLLPPAISRCLKARLYGWLPLSDAAGIILSISGIPKIIPFYYVLLLLGIIDVRLNTIGFRNLSNNIRILTPNEGHLREREGPRVEKTPFFDVFRKVLINKLLHRFKTVIWRFTNNEFAKGKVSLRQRLCFIV